MKVGRNFLVLALTLAVVILSGCGGMSGDMAELQTMPLSQSDNPQVVSGLSQQPTDGPTGSISFKLHLYDVDNGSGTASRLSAPPASGGGSSSSGPGINLQYEYLKRVENIAVALFEKSTDHLKYLFTFPVVNGEVNATMQGLIPNAYSIEITARAVDGSLNLFTGQGDCEVKAGEDNTAVVFMQTDQIAGIMIAVKGQPGNFTSTDPILVNTISTTIDSGDAYSSQGFGYYHDGNLYLIAAVQLYPKPATQLQISYQDLDGQAYVQEISFDIMGLIDGVKANGAYEVAYQPAGNLNVDVVWPDQSLSIRKSPDSPLDDIAVDATNQTLAIFDFTASGENIKVQNLNVRATVSTDGGIRNGKVFVDDVQVGTTKNLTNNTAVNFTFGSTFIVKAGTTAKVKIVGDIKTTASTSFSGGESVLITLATGSSNVLTMTSLSALSRPAIDIDANTLNITLASVTVTKFSGFGEAVVVSGTLDAKLASFVVGAGAVEGVSVNSTIVYLSEVNANSSTITRMYLKDHATGTQLGDSITSISTTNIFTVNFNLVASSGKVIDLYGDIKAGAPAGTWVANVSVQGVGLTTSLAVSGGSATNAMQTITIVEHGELFATNGAKPASAILIGGTTGNYVGQQTISALYEGHTVERLKLKTQYYFCLSTTGIAIKYKDKSGNWQQSSQVWSIPSDEAEGCTATFTGLIWYIPANGSVNLDEYIDMATIANGAFSGAVGTITFLHDEGFRAVGDSGNIVTSVGDHNLNGNTFVVRKSKPTFTVLDAGSDPTLRLFRFSVVADSAGNIDLKQLGFYFIPNGPTITSVALYDEDGNQITDPVDPVDNQNTGTYKAKLIIGAIDTSANSEPVLGGHDVLTISSTIRTFEVRGTVVGYNPAAGDSITVGFAQDTEPFNNGRRNDGKKSDGLFLEVEKKQGLVL